MNIPVFEQQMTRIIPSFAGFTEFTTSVPKIYYDVKSMEQRTLGICKLLGKVIAYADMLGENVEEIAKTLQDIEDGKLDALIEAAIIAWFDENQPQMEQDIADLKSAVHDLQLADVDIVQAIRDEESERIRQDGLLSDDIDLEENARKAEDAKLLNYSSIENDAYGFNDAMKVKADRNSFTIELAEGISETEIENFTYAGKTVAEIFDPDASWAFYVQPDELVSFPVVGGVVPTQTGEIALDTDTDTITFDSWDTFAESAAYFTWSSIPVTTGHVIAIFALCEFDEFKQGKFGFETSQLAFAVGSIKTRQIVGCVRSTTENTFGIIMGNVPLNTSLYVRENPIAKTNVLDLSVIDLTELFNDGQSDNISDFVKAYNVWLASKSKNTSGTKTFVKTYETANIADLDAYNTFIALMNKYSMDMQLVNSTWKSASGYPSYPGLPTYNSQFNNFSCPIDMLKILIACSSDSFLQKCMSGRFCDVIFEGGACNAAIHTPNSVTDPTQDLSYMRTFGKGGSLNKNFTGEYAPYGVVNMVASCTLKNGHTGYIAVMNTPFNSGSGLVYNNVLRYYYLIQNALNDVIDGTNPASVTYGQNLQDGIDYAAQPTSFAAFIAPPGFDKCDVMGQSVSRLLAWLNEAKLYLGNNDGSDTENDTQVVTASVAKLLTAWIAVNECDINENIVLHSTDFIGGSGAAQINSRSRAHNLCITLKDAITAMLYYSDNTIATAIARHVGARYAGKTNIGKAHLFLA